MLLGCNAPRRTAGSVRSNLCRFPRGPSGVLPLVASSPYNGVCYAHVEGEQMSTISVEDLCAKEDCDKPVQSRGLCRSHYYYWRKEHGPRCSVEGCDEGRMTRGWCQPHYKRWQRHGDPLGVAPRMDRPDTCQVDGCESEHFGRGLCQKHWWRWNTYGDPRIVKQIRGDDAARFFSYVDKHDDCWEWIGAHTLDGYGMFYLDGTNVGAHRWSYEHHVGPIPDGLEIDHLCRVRNCVNPDHLEAVTKRENVLRGESLAAQNAKKTHCKRGHPFAGDNLYVNPTTGGRTCRTCQLAAQARYRERKRREG